MRYCLALIALASLGCSAPPPAPEPTASPSARPSVAAKNFERITRTGRAIFRTKKGKRWLMEAFDVNYNDGKQTAELKNVDWILSDPQGRKKIRIQAPQATYRIQQDVVEFQGVVQARRYDTQDLVKANHLVWSGKAGVLKGSRGVTWVRGKTRLKADTATTTDKLEHIVMEGNVQLDTVLEGEGSLDQGR